MPTRPPLVVDWGKLVISLAGITAALVLALVDKDHGTVTAAVGLIGTVIGYAYGNGRTASRGEWSVPMIRPERRHRLADSEEDGLAYEADEEGGC